MPPQPFSFIDQDQPLGLEIPGEPNVSPCIFQPYLQYLKEKLSLLAKVKLLAAYIVFA